MKKSWLMACLLTSVAHAGTTITSDANGLKFAPDGALTKDDLGQLATKADMTALSFKLEQSVNELKALLGTKPVEPTKPADPVAPTNAFKSEFFTGTALAGSPVLTRTDSALDFNWGTNGPGAGVAADNFSARFEGTFNFAAGAQRFSVTSDDGVKLWIDDKLLVDKWVGRSATTDTVDVTLTAGIHKIKVEYYEGTGDAVLRLKYGPATVDPVSPAPTNGIVKLPTFRTDGLVGFNVQNTSTATVAPTYVTFGQTFIKGALKPGPITADFGAGATAAQLDVKTKWDDGSVKMAVVTVLAPQLAAGKTASGALKAGGSSAPALSMAEMPGYTLKVTVGLPEPLTFDVASKIAEASKSDTWLSGALAAQTRVVLPVKNALRLVVDVTRYADNTYISDVQLNNDITMGPAGGEQNYSLTIDNGGMSYNLPTMRHRQYMNFHKVLYTKDTSALNVQLDTAYLIKTGVILPFKYDIGVKPERLTAMTNQMASSQWGLPFASNGITQYMPGTGGRGDIGIHTEPQLVWLFTQDDRARRYVLGQADAAFGIPWHFWDAAKGRWLNADDYPNIWTDGRGNDPRLTQGVDMGPWSTDAAHSPNHGFIPYLLTGQRSYYDETMAEASFALVGQWHAKRQGSKGIVLDDSQIRGGSWTVRDFDNAAVVAVDGSWEKTYFQKLVDNNWQFIVDSAPKWKTEYGEVAGYLPGSYGSEGNLYFAPWQQDYLASVLFQSVARGNLKAKAAYDTFLNNFLLGRFTHESAGFNPRDGVAYNLKIRGDNGIYKTWKDFGAGQVSAGMSNGTGWSKSDDGNYALLGLGTLEMIHYYTKDPSALKWRDWIIANKGPFTTPEYRNDALGLVFQTP